MCKKKKNLWAANLYTDSTELYNSLWTEAVVLKTTDYVRFTTTVSTWLGMALYFVASAVQWNLPWRTLPIVATSLMLSPVEALLIEYSQMQTPHYSIKQKVFSVPLIPGPYKIHLINADAHMRHCWSINSTTGHYDSTGTHSMRFWLAFPASIQQERALERTSEVLKSI